MAHISDIEVAREAPKRPQYGFSTDANLRGAPIGHTVQVREGRLSAGAGFVVVTCGEIMTMQGLPRMPLAEAIMLNGDGTIEGLFQQVRLAGAGCAAPPGTAQMEEV